MQRHLSKCKYEQSYYSFQLCENQASTEVMLMSFFEPQVATNRHLELSNLRQLFNTVRLWAFAKLFRVYVFAKLKL